MTGSTFPVVTEDRYFEDYVPGSIFEFGTISADEPEIINFAQRFDPQSIHMDQNQAAAGPFGGLIASGWHTAGLMMRLYADHYLSKVASLGSPGGDNLRWIKPVRPGDKLRIRVSVLETNRSRSKPDRGIVRSGVEVLNQDGDAVMSIELINLFRCRKVTSSQ